MTHRYTEEQINWLRKHRPKLTEPELAEKFNCMFGTAISKTALKQTCRRYKIKAGSNGRFIAGCTAWNDGLKGLNFSVSTQFKKGHVPHTHRPVGSERTVEGYVEIKIAEPKKWQHKHVYVWEQRHGKRPKGSVIIFLDSDKSNFDPDNLHLVTRRELLQMNRNKYSRARRELKPTVMALSKLESAVFAAQKLQKEAS